MFATFVSSKNLKILRMRRNVWIDDFIEENDISFAVLMSALEKREKQLNKRVKKNNVW